MTCGPALLLEEEEASGATRVSGAAEEPADEAWRFLRAWTERVGDLFEPLAERTAPGHFRQRHAAVDRGVDVLAAIGHADQRGSAQRTAHVGQADLRAAGAAVDQ